MYVKRHRYSSPDSPTSLRAPDRPQNSREKIFVVSRLTGTGESEPHHNQLARRKDGHHLAVVSHREAAAYAKSFTNCRR
jgi:hypothetical protein